MKKLLISLICLLSTHSALAGNRALLIGIGEYGSSTISALPDPQNDLQETQEIAQKVLGFRVDEIQVLKGKEATQQNILQALQQLETDTKANDNVFFYYTGHGAQVRDQDQDEADGRDEVILPYDAENTKQTLLKPIRDDVLREHFDRMKDRNIIAIFDSCNSGTVTRGLSNRTLVPVRTIPSGEYATPSPEFLSRLSPEAIVNSSAFQQARQEIPFIERDRQRTVWSAADASQYAYVDLRDPTRTGGLFTQALYDGLIKQKADYNHNGRITNAELFAYTQEQATQFCTVMQRERHTVCQFGLTPHLSIEAEQRSMQFGFPNSTLSTETTVTDALPQQQAASIDLRIETTQGATTHVPHQETLFVIVNSTQAGYLYLLDHDSDNEIRFLFPNQPQQDNRIEAGQMVHIPNPIHANFQLTAFKKGQAEILAIVSQDPLDTQQLQREVAGFKAINPQQLGKFISKIQATYVGDRINRPINYAIKRLAYTVQ